MIRMGLIGCGRISQQHAAGYLGCEGVELAAIADVRQDAMEVLASQFAVKPRMFTDYREMLGSVKLDAASIALPDFMHAPAAVDCADAGVHVFCEKPPALNAEEVQQMCEAVERAGVKNMFRFNYRFHVPTLYVRQLVAEGRLGRMFHFRSQLFVERMSNPNVGLEWRMQRERGGYGALSDLGIHILDRTCFIFNLHPDDITSVSATSHFFITERRLDDESRSGKVTAYDAAAFVLKFRTGAIALGEVTRFSPGSNVFQVDGSGGSIRFDGTTGELQFYEKRPTDHQRPQAEFSPLSIPPEFADAHQQTEFQHFVECLKHDRTPEADFGYGLACQRVLDALDESAREGRTIELQPNARA